ncbi:MAG: NAD-dependent epimerase/dehydratase family protein [bacterium]
MTDRREFLKRSALVGGALGLGVTPSLGAAAERSTSPSTRRNDPPRAAAPLNILILGGTGFTGPEQVEYATARGHKVTLLNRNKTRPDFFKGRVEQLVGDLNDDVSALKGRKFDVVIDNPTTFPAWVRNAAQHLGGNTKHYIFISTISVYPDNSVPGQDETAGTTPMPADLDPYTIDRANSGKYYGALKTFSEKEVEKHYPGINTIIRPGLIVGLYDRTDRFTYWPYRIDKGGEVLAPGTPNDPVQFIDSRDLAEWTIRMAEGRVFGTYQATGPAKPLTIAEMLYGIKAVTTAGAQFTWVPAAFLEEQKIRPWRDMTVWMPGTGRTAGFMGRNVAKAVAAGLTFRPLAVTAKDTLDWNRTRPDADLKAIAEGGVGGISAAREAEVLAAWKAKRAT